MRSIEDVERAKDLLNAVNQRSLDAAVRGSCPSCEALFDQVYLDGDDPAVRIVEADRAVVRMDHRADCAMLADVAELEDVVARLGLQLLESYVVLGAATDHPALAKVLQVAS